MTAFGERPRTDRPAAGLISPACVALGGCIGVPACHYCGQPTAGETCAACGDPVVHVPRLNLALDATPTPDGPWTRLGFRRHPNDLARSRHHGRADGYTRYRCEAGR